LFGGDGQPEDYFTESAPLNDLWNYSPSTNTWSWLSGSDAAAPPAVFGTQGVASSTNVPSGRAVGAAWTDSTGKFWLWGGETGGDASGSLTDFWSLVAQ
jgi:hypothetical protein